MTNDDGLSSAVNREEIKAFFEGWVIYQKVIGYNYMIHREIVAHVGSRLSDYSGGELRILELGCGDAHVIRKVADGHAISRYVGVDLSDMALHYADEGLKGALQNFELVNGNMEDAVTSMTECFDVILAGYSLHHLEGERKNKMFAALAPRLADGGVLIVYDLVSREREHRDVYTARICAYFDSNWLQMSFEQLVGIRAHVTEKDFPESLSSWKAIGESAGFGDFREGVSDAEGIFTLMEFRR